MTRPAERLGFDARVAIERSRPEHDVVPLNVRISPNKYERSNCEVRTEENVKYEGGKDTTYDEKPAGNLFFLG
jgi:hypothetical protein